MTRYADPHRCPDCRTRIPAAPAFTSCPECGLPLEGPTAVELFATLRRADMLVASLRASVVPAGAAVTPAPAYLSYPAPSRPVPAATSGSTEKPPVRWTVPGVLLALGGLCLVVGAMVFLVVAWSVLGVGGRTGVLVTLTGVSAVGTLMSARRDLRGAAETFATVTGLFLALDLGGAFSAGWFGDRAAGTELLIGSLVVLAATAAGNAYLARGATGPLVAPQLIADAAALAAAFAAVVRYEVHETTTIAITVVAAMVLGEAARRTGQPILTWGARGVAGLMWAALVIDGWAQAAEAWDVDGRGAATWFDVAQLLVAAGLAATLALATRVLDLGPVLVRQGAIVAACWLAPGAIAAVFGDTVTWLVLIGVGATVVIAGLGLVLRPLATELGVAALGPAAGAILGAVAAAGLLVAAIAAEVSEQVARSLDSLSPDLLAVADLDPVDPDVAAPWTIPLAVLAAGLAVAVLIGKRLPRPTAAWAWTGAAVLVPVCAVTGLWYAPYLLAATIAAGVLAAYHVVTGVRRAAAWTPVVDAAIASGWVAVAGLVAVYHPAPAVAVALLTTAVVTSYAVRFGPAVALVATPVLVAASAGALCWLADAPGTWSVAVVIVAVATITTAVGSTRRLLAPEAGSPRQAMYGAGLATVLTVVVWGGLAATASTTWLAAYLSLAAASAAAVAIVERSVVPAGVAAGLELCATWLRLGGAGVETPEAYTLPVAAVLLAFGGWALWRDPTVGTMKALGPGLAAGLVPTLFLAMTDPVSPRAAVLAAVCALLVAICAVWRVQAPFVYGAAAGAALVVVELAPYHDAVRPWLLLSVAGACLVVAGVRWEYLAGVGRRSWGRVSELR